MSKLSVCVLAIASSILLSCRQCQAGGLTDVLGSGQIQTSGQNIVHWAHLRFHRDAVAAEILRMVEESSIDIQEENNKYENFGRQIEPIQESGRSSILTKLGETMRNTLAPLNDYMKIAERYRKWLKQHRELEGSASIEDGLRPAMEVLREEYAKADELLEKRHLETICDRQSKVDINSVDFIFQVLAELIGRLEKRLLWEKGSLGLTTAQRISRGEATNLPDSEKRVQVAMEKVKRVASRQILRETLRLARIALFNTMAVGLSRNEYPQNDIRCYISTIVGLLAGTDNSVAVSYLRDLKFRAALAALSYVDLRSIHKRLKCKNKTNEEEQRGNISV